MLANETKRSETKRSGTVSDKHGRYGEGERPKGLLRRGTKVTLYGQKEQGKQDKCNVMQTGFRSTDDSVGSWSARKPRIPWDHLKERESANRTAVTG